MMILHQDTSQRRERNLGQGHLAISQNRVSCLFCWHELDLMLFRLFFSF